MGSEVWPLVAPEVGVDWVLGSADRTPDQLGLRPVERERVLKFITGPVFSFLSLSLTEQKHFLIGSRDCGPKSLELWNGNPEMSTNTTRHFRPAQLELPRKVHENNGEKNTSFVIITNACVNTDQTANIKKVYNSDHLLS